MAKYFGATITGVCSTANLALVKTIGARVINDYAKENFSTRGKMFDIIFDTVGKLSYTRCKKALKPKGIFLEAGIGLGIFKPV